MDSEEFHLFGTSLSLFNPSRKITPLAIVTNFLILRAVPAMRVYHSKAPELAMPRWNAAVGFVDPGPQTGCNLQVAITDAGYSNVYEEDDF
jgi:hypothetical protein